MDFEKIVFEVFKTDTVELTNLDEGFLPLNATLAFLTLKRNALNKLRKFSKDVKKKGHDVKAKSLMAKEQIRAGSGISSGSGDSATVYTLTKEQMEILSQIQEKYGKEIVDEVLEFRKNILAPYQLIKRLVKANKVVTSKDKFGMTHAQYKNAVESGLKKIEKRGQFFGKGDEKSSSLDELDKAIEALKELKKEFQVNGRLRESIVNRVLKYYNLGTSDFDESLEDLRKSYDELKKNEKILTHLLVKPERIEKDPIAAQDIVKRNIELRKGVIKQERESDTISRLVKEDVDITTSNIFTKNNKFNAALGKYMLRRNIIDELRVEGNNRFKKTYLSIIDGLIERAIERRKEILSRKIKDRTDIEFNEIERKIFKIRPSVKTQYSGDINDYIQVITDKDFISPEYIQRPKELVDAEASIEAEVKRFERALQKILNEEDFEKLKRFRLINNLITVGELKSPEKLFKTPEEIRNKTSSDSEDDSSDEQEE